MIRSEAYCGGGPAPIVDLGAVVGKDISLLYESPSVGSGLEAAVTESLRLCVIKTT